LLVILAARRHTPLWPYYAFMATLGAVVGGYLTYRLAEKSEKETLEKKIGRPRAQKLYDRFKTHGFATVVAAAILPPPFPTSPIVLTAGALHYPRNNFLLALTLGRALRYFALGLAAHLYGRAILRVFANYYQPLLYTLIVLAVLGAASTLLYFKWYRPRHRDQHPQHA
jgi:membrane protein YqaA with SNARE-associated domain